MPNIVNWAIYWNFEFFLFCIGLTMIFYTQNEEFLSGISEGYGMRLQIHEQGTFPMPDQEGIFISSSFETHIGLRLVELLITLKL